MRCSVAESNRKVGGDAHIDRVVDATAKFLVGADGNEVLIEKHSHRTYRVVRQTPQDYLGEFLLVRATRENCGRGLDFSPVEKCLKAKN